MQGIEFEEEKGSSGISTKASQPATQKTSFMFSLLEKAGVKDRATANLILLGVAVIFFAITIYLYAGLLGFNNPPKLTPEQIQAQIKAMQGAK